MFPYMTMAASFVRLSMNVCHEKDQDHCFKFQGQASRRGMTEYMPVSRPLQGRSSACDIITETPKGLFFSKMIVSEVRRVVGGK